MFTAFLYSVAIGFGLYVGHNSAKYIHSLIALLAAKNKFKKAERQAKKAEQIHKKGVN